MNCLSRIVAASTPQTSLSRAFVHGTKPGLWTWLKILLFLPMAFGWAGTIAAWEADFDRELRLLGHRNWILVADSAYPLQVSPGIKTLDTQAPMLETLTKVMSKLDEAKHLRPRCFTDSELQHVPETHAKGIEAYRQSVAKLLKNHQVLSLPHEELIAQLDAAGQTYRVLVLKTDLAIPYTSVFIQLECGYWSDEAEKELRAKLERGGQSESSQQK